MVLGSEEEKQAEWMFWEPENSEVLVASRSRNILNKRAEGIASDGSDAKVNERNKRYCSSA